MPLPTMQQQDPTSDIVRTIMTSYSMGETYTSGHSGGSAADSDDWPIAVHNMPDAPDNMIAVFDTAPVRQGRLMWGKVLFNPGFQIRVRSNDYQWGWQQANNLMRALSESVLPPPDGNPISLNSRAYHVQTVRIVSGPLAMGKEEKVSKRYLFSINGTLTVDRKF